MKSLTESDLQLLEDFWNKKLSPKAHAELEERLKSDATFQAAATEWQLFLSQVILPPEEEIKEAKAIKDRLVGYRLQAEKSSAQKRISYKNERIVS